MIHGLFVNNLTWKPWVTYLESKGFTVHTPSNPAHEGQPLSLRSNIAKNLTKTGLRDAVDNVIGLINTLPEKPIVIGHSLGGLIVQKLVELDKVVAGVCLNGAPPKNIIAPFSTVKIVFPVVNPLKGNSAFLGSKEWYHRAFFNNYTKAQSDELYEQFAVPESRKIARDTLLTSFANINFKQTHSPLLFTAGGHDNIFSPSLIKRIANSYKDKSGISDFKEFEDKSHFIAGEEGWEDVVNYILNWVERTAKKIE